MQQSVEEPLSFGNEVVELVDALPFFYEPRRQTVLELPNRWDTHRK